MGRPEEDLDLRQRIGIRFIVGWRRGERHGAGVAVAGLGSPDNPQATSAPSSASRTIQVSASGQATAQPDLGMLRVGVEATADDPTTARSRVADNISQVRSALEEMGIDAEVAVDVSRMTGWTAHLLEQWQDNRLIRPRAEYVGPRGLRVQPIAQR